MFIRCNNRVLSFSLSWEARSADLREGEGEKGGGGGVGTLERGGGERAVRM